MGGTAECSRPQRISPGGEWGQGHRWGEVERAGATAYCGVQHWATAGLRGTLHPSDGFPSSHADFSDRTLWLEREYCTQLNSLDPCTTACRV